jgi:LysR family glycine cleavage system transcriptional activator
MHHVDFTREDVDMAVRHGDGNWTGLDAVQLCTEKLFPVCSAHLISAQNGRLDPSSVFEFPMLHLDDHSGWSRWLAATKVQELKPLHGLVMNRASMVIDAAVNGQGIALARTALAAWDIINKRLVMPYSAALPLSNTYWIVAPHTTTKLPKIVTFRDWLLAEAADDDRRVKELVA